ncbi:SGNH/GDSL hydrolase family protein [Stenotrophomonas sp. GD03908]|uniref:SGNH/GDSL hydrolase family protein n=1 Tax=Stenotrophomonas maltophilia TaxID=40324 RepID=A0AAJ2WK30_STEMA|nr:MULTISPECIES: SGNH/GDSL hydrolase family protein [Stenotrophomonas]MBH1481500.1 SGNH/GDSL hydrolase family protein [Stenotrophomonas maltophilia]MCU1062149.1 SGNH/GDSL hydrolase family protein [Stenotrophomonas maltophilia]MDH0980086.1 SGNH/GDSL hydrolase family protein [Stenotrophomonas sp. GD03908]MDQ7293235.1 SGNH/GDSL hydrolase family protein [Stenotrophomonas sp. Sm0041]MDZ5764700.1 SGNH/GDSL hydrolase family protein [Stenotrophomonas maltophilia]
MRSATRCSLLFGLLVVCTSVEAGEVPAVSGLLATPVEQLSQDELQYLQRTVADFGQLQRYRGANAQLPATVSGQPRVVFFGDSITEGWGREGSAGFFPGKGWLNRGISGQTTAQMLVRFSQDVLALKPQVVVILAGTNDIAGNTGPSTQGMIEDNLHAMVELARAHGIAVVLASVLPVSEYPWMPGITPAPKVRALNTALKRYAEAKQLVYLDYYTPMVNAAGGLDPQLAEDGVHPTTKGYAVMAPLAEAAVTRALEQR